jgi:hypothetical protein
MLFLFYWYINIYNLLSSCFLKIICFIMANIYIEVLKIAKKILTDYIILSSFHCSKFIKKGFQPKNYS